MAHSGSNQMARLLIKPAECLENQT